MVLCKYTMQTAVQAKSLKTYSFPVVIEPDEDRWFAHCPALKDYAAASWGYTREEAYRHIQEVVQMVIDELREDGMPLPEADSSVQVSSEPRVMALV